MAIRLEKIKEEKKKGKITFLFEGSSEVFTNTIRRLIIEEVPTLAVEDLEIKDNNSALYDEMLALRLGLCPLKTDLKSYNLKEKCKCKGEGCARCELKLSLKASKKGYVYAKETESTDPKCNFVHDNMIIVKLLPKQKLNVTMTAIMGKGKEHIKWSPGWSYYFKEPVVKIGKVKDPETLAKQCADGVFKVKGDKVELVQDKVYDSQLLQYYEELDEGIKIEYTDNFVFSLESWGQLSCKEILKESAAILIEKIEEMEKLI